MKRATPIFIFAALLAIAAGSGGLRHYYGSRLTTLNMGHVFVSTNSPVSFWVGNSVSNPVMVGIEAGYDDLTTLSNANLTITNHTSIATYGTCVVTLPSATAGRSISFVKRDDGNLLTITNGTVEGEADGARISTRWSGELISDGTKWWIR